MGLRVCLFVVSAVLNCRTERMNWKLVLVFGGGENGNVLRDKIKHSPGSWEGEWRGSGKL